MRLTTSCLLIPPANCLVIGHSPRLEKRFSSLFCLYKETATACVSILTRQTLPSASRLLRLEKGFLQDLLHTIARPLLLELALHVGDHAARNLAVEDFRFHSGDIGEELRV